MGLAETLVLYAIAGLAVSAAVVLSNPRRSLVQVLAQSASAAAFWPLYLPILLSQRAAEAESRTSSQVAAPDALAIAIGQVEHELDTALSGLDGWAEDAMSREAARISELRQALAAQATRIREMNVLLAADFCCGPSAIEGTPLQLTGEAAERWQASSQARTHNVARLQSVRDQAQSDLLATLAWIRELVSMIHLAKFTGAPASRTEELVAQIAAAVEGVSAVTWKDELSAAPSALPQHHVIEQHNDLCFPTSVQ